MAKEIERKFIVTDTSYQSMAVSALKISQGYISLRPEGTVRVRIKGDRGYLTVKGMTTGGTTRDEWEYQIPAEDARQMLERVTEGVVIEKTRYEVPFGGHVWEVDCFEGALSGLTVAEVELSEASERVELPPFVGEEVTGNPRYYNSSLAGLV